MNQEGFIKIARDKEKAMSMLKMADVTLDFINSLDAHKFSSHVAKEYYDVIRELMCVVLLLDGYKTVGENAHKRLVEYIEETCHDFSEYEITLIDDLRVTRNRIAYDGFFVSYEYVERKCHDIQKIIAKLKSIINKKM
jgi:hypothetical protein